MSRYCIVQFENGSIGCPEVKTDVPNVGDWAGDYEELATYEGVVIAVIDGESGAGRLLSIVAAIDGLDSSRDEPDPLQATLEELLTAVARGVDATHPLLVKA